MSFSIAWCVSIDIIQTVFFWKTDESDIQFYEDAVSTFYYWMYTQLFIFTHSLHECSHCANLKLFFILFGNLISTLYVATECNFIGIRLIGFFCLPLTMYDFFGELRVHFIE